MNPAPDLDSFDLKLLAELQRDGRLSHVELSERIALSPSQVSRRVQRLVESGVIRRFRAELDARRIGIGLTAYCLLSLKFHGAGGMEAFHARIRALPEVLECHALTGEADYLLKVAVADLKAFSDFLNTHLTHAPEIATVRTSIVLDSIKDAVEYALPTRL